MWNHDGDVKEANGAMIGPGEFECKWFCFPTIPTPPLSKTNQSIALQKSVTTMAIANATLAMTTASLAMTIATHAIAILTLTMAITIMAIWQ